MKTSRRSYLSLLIKGPIKNAKRAAQRRELSVTDCITVSGRDVRCYTPCSAGAERKVGAWFAERGQVKKGRGYPPGTLLHFSGSCPVSGFGRRKRRR